MTVAKRKLKSGGHSWITRWHAPNGVKRQKTFDRKRDAEDWMLEVRRRQRLGELALMDSREQTLREYWDEWVTSYSKPHHASSTQKQALSLWTKYVEAELGDFTLGELCSEPLIIQRFQASLTERDCTVPTVLKVLHLIQSMMQRAVEWNLIATNPVKACRKPKQPRPKAATVIAPERVEIMRQHLLALGKIQDATLLSVLAYSGLRPGEALALKWGDVGPKTIHIFKANSDGVLKDTKTGAHRNVTILQPLRDDLTQLMMQAGNPAPNKLIFPRTDGQLLTTEDWSNWRNRIFKPAATHAGFDSARPYDLRHTFVSLLIEEGRSPIYTAMQAGHSAAMTLNTYGHVFAEYVDEPGVPAVERIMRARASVATPAVAPLEVISARDDERDNVRLGGHLALVK